jgi:diguanylate cyclase (GGDEF)-like protein/PAS domain S-box-containing protein
MYQSDSAKARAFKTNTEAGWTGRAADPASLEAALRESETLNRSILDASADCIKILSTTGEIQLMNAPGLCAMELGSADQVKGRVWSSLWPVDMQSIVSTAVERAKAGSPARFTGFCPTALGSPRWWDVVVTPMRADDGVVERLLAISRDVTATRQAAEELRWASEHDALTALPNRRAFEAHLQAAILRAMEGGTSVGLLLIDLDHFKHVNDTLGHAAGDTLLTTFGRRLRKTLRARDYVARLGGDEFAVVLHDASTETELLAAGRAIGERLSHPVVYEGRVITSGASIGGAIFPRDAQCANDLLKHADTALYALKASGRGGTKLFHGVLRDQLQRAASQLSLARTAIGSQALFAVYQPKVELESGRIMGFEALMRWQHPTRGMQVPDSIAEAFRDYEQASAIGEQMQKGVLRDIAALSARELPLGRVSINAAPAEFLRNDYAERLLERLQAAGISPDQIEIEVTEQVFTDRGTEFVGRALEVLHDAGVSIALDDFGTGYSSLSHLRDFPVDVVKIDRSFISEVNSNTEMAAIVTAVIDLARSLSIGVVAEGIEVAEQAAFLRDRGCDYGQGFYFGRPAPVDEIPRLIGPPVKRPQLSLAPTAMLASNSVHRSSSRCGARLI